MVLPLCYACISTTGPTTSGAVLAEGDVLGISSNTVTATATAYYTYSLDSEIELTGGTTYYIVFLSSNTPSNGYYTVTSQRVSLNTSYGNYAAGTRASNGNLQNTWTPGFKATLTTDAAYTVNYTCISTSDNSTITSGSYSDVVGSISAPTLEGYIFSHATTTNGDAYTMTSEVTEDLDLNFYYKPLVSALSDLSNTKVYTITCERGDLTTQNGSLTSTQKSGAPAAKNFAILNYDGNYYLYSVDDEKFVGNDCNLSVYPSPNADFITTPTALSTKLLYKLVFGSNRLNTNASGAVIDNYNTDDGGNMFVIIEAGDFDPTDALEKFTDRTPYYEALAAKIAEAEGMVFGTELGEYIKGSDYDTALANAQTVYGNTEATVAELEAAATALTTAIGNCTLNMPEAGMFLTIKSMHDTYLSNTESTTSGRLSFTATTDASNIFYFDGNHLLGFKDGIMANGREVGSIGTTGVAYWFEKSTVTAGKYVVRFNPDGNNNRYLYAWDTSKNYADQNSGDAAECAFTLEKVTELPVKLNPVDGKFYATFSAPMGVTGVEGAEIYTVKVEGNQAKYTAYSGQVPAEKGLLLIGDAAEATVTLGDVDATTEFETDMQPQFECIAAATAKEQNKLFLGTNSGKLGFYNLKSETGKSGGFKAYIQNTASASASGEAKGFVLVADNEATGIDSIHNGQQTIDNGAIYNLQGQKVTKAQKGVFIQNGKKVVVK